MRLRLTARAAAVRATLIPKRAPIPGLEQAYTQKHASRVRSPSLKTRLNSAGMRSRALAGKLLQDEIKGRVSPGLWHVGRSKPGGRGGWPYARETRGCVCGVTCLAGKFFSLLANPADCAVTAGADKGAILDVCDGRLSIYRGKIHSILGCG